MSQFVHIPVLANEVVSYLDPRPGAIYFDGTLGGGGHAEQTLISSAPDGRLIAVDRDETALAAARSRLDRFTDRINLVHDSFANAAAVITSLGLDTVDGFLLDLGPSSPQFDQPERGFSFSGEGPIDMRMDRSGGESALELIRRLSVEELAAILRDYGEERYHKRIASRIKEGFRDGRLTSTIALAELVTQAIPPPARRSLRIHPATRTFQALRIAVNKELEQLEEFLTQFPDLLAPGGRCVIISFHSLEDRLVKHRFRDLAKCSSLPPDLAIAAGEPVHPTCEVLTRKPVFPAPEEVETNPRARSARLRACRKLAA